MNVLSLHHFDMKKAADNLRDHGYEVSKKVYILNTDKPKVDKPKGGPQNPMNANYSKDGKKNQPRIDTMLYH